MTDAAWEFPPLCLEGHQPTQQNSLEASRIQRAEQGRGSGWKGGLWGVITHIRRVEAARKARSKRPASAERTEVMTIIQPLRRPGHVSMELGALPAHIGTIQRPAIIQRLSVPPHSSSVHCLMAPESILQPLSRPLLLDLPSGLFLRSLPLAHVHQADLGARSPPAAGCG